MYDSVADKTSEADEAFITLVKAMSFIIDMANNPMERINNAFSNKALLQDAGKIIHMYDIINDVCRFMPEPITIVVKGPHEHSDFMSLLPSFPKDKITINVQHA
jgi:hypothetical protein